MAREEKGQGLFELVATKLPIKERPLICLMLLIARAVAGASGPTRMADKYDVRFSEEFLIIAADMAGALIRGWTLELRRNCRSAAY